MLPRNMHMRTGGYDLPGVESSDVPLIGYRPLQPDSPSHRSRRGSGGGGESETSQSTVVEEQDDGVIYTVVVKQHHGAPGSLTSVVSRSQCLKAGTEEKLVLHLLHSFSMGDSSFITIFLSTYRSFTSTGRVLDILTDRLENPPGDSERSHTRQSFNKAVCSVFSNWLSEYPEDFKCLEGPSHLLRLVPLLPKDSLSAVDLRARLLHIAEELSEKALLPDARKDRTGFPSPPPDASMFEATNVLGFPAAIIAEQLTRIETELFVRLVPYHCLGSLWSQRDKKGREGVCWSVRATIHQFNKLANAVLASCLWSTNLRSQQRARLLEKWISVAEECRARKNFSSLYAIVSALQSNPIHRLRKTWQDTDREAVKRYEELSEIFSDKDNYSQSRELLKEEGTSKFANLDHRLNNKLLNRSHAQGTVPYLGIFLTDLTMLDTAVKDMLDNGYINFDKRRRVSEFEVLAQIRLLQSSCKNCVFSADGAFVRWYQSVPTLTEEESYRLSNEIEAPGEPSPRGITPTVIITQCPDLSRSRTSLTGDSESLFDFPSPVNHLLSKLTKHMRSPSVSCLDVDTSSSASESGSAAQTPSTPVKSHRRSISCGNNPPNNVQGSGPDMRIIRIRMDLQDGNMYRSILVTSNDKSPTVIGSALEKHSQDPKQTSRYELIQLLPEGKELVIPATGNVFYAMSSSSVDFLLRRKGGSTPLTSESIETSATFPRIKAKGRRLLVLPKTPTPGPGLHPSVLLSSQQSSFTPIGRAMEASWCSGSRVPVRERLDLIFFHSYSMKNIFFFFFFKCSQPPGNTTPKNVIAFNCS
ncbi:ral guanine nucleotide dissociation stimulator-like 2 isoform X3 [Pseudoliparis swirei]|uniref:ral guanine nucleotide dissociation stimulator-like 2 isoform X3 n=1 Tax=Pseudoliparis swirei TaxID=2059687 RepID=UPI0024BDF3D7|nr:ral guanine nucleotide dissociation stimulator-like 2 isoform X3 [Pseudoliparis swirei]